MKYPCEQRIGSLEERYKARVREVIERRSENPIVSIHDQDAGDNVLKELMPNGVEMTIHNQVVGDPVIWGMLQEDADPREGPRGGGGDGGYHRRVVGDGQNHGHGPHGGEGQQDGRDGGASTKRAAEGPDGDAGAGPHAATVVGGQQAIPVVPDEQVDRSVRGFSRASSAAARCTCR